MCTECGGHVLPDDRILQRQNPGLLRQFGKFHFAPSSPSAFHSHDDFDAVVKQDFQVNVLFGRRRNTSEIKIGPPFAQIAGSLDIRHDGCDVNGDSRVFPAQPVEHGRHHAHNDGIGRHDLHLADRRIGEELDFLHRLAELVEHGGAPVEQGAAIGRRLGAVAAAIKQADADRTFQIGDRFRDGRLRRIQELGCSAHAAGLHDRHQHVQVVKLHPPSDAIAQLHGTIHCHPDKCFNTVTQLIERSGYDEKTARAVGTMVHTAPDEAGQVLALVKPRFAAVYHFSNDFDTGIEIEREIRKHYDGPLALVQDLMVFNVTANDVCVRMAVTASHVWPNKERHEAGFR